jgi:hypothetical protein
MKGMLSLVGLLVVLAIVGISVRNQLRAVRPSAPVPASASAEAASAPFGGTSSPSVAQFQQELDKQMRNASERAASAGGEADVRP